jgi:hypothetical protein
MSDCDQDYQFSFALCWFVSHAMLCILRVNVQAVQFCNLQYCLKTSHVLLSIFFEHDS